MPGAMTPRWISMGVWTAAHGLMFGTLALLTSLLFQQHPRVGRVWGILLHYVLPGATGLLQTVFLRKTVRHCWMWFPATLLGVPFCLNLNDGWGVLPAIGFGLGVAQAVLLRPRGILVSIYWIVFSGVGWFLPWVAIPLLNPFSAGILAGESNLELSPIIATAWTGVIYAAFTSSTLFLLTPKQLLRPREQGTRLDWLTPSGMFLVMVALGECSGRNFDVVMHLRNAAAAAVFGRADSFITRWLDPFLIGILFLGSEIAYQVLTVSQRWLFQAQKDSPERITLSHGCESGDNGGDLDELSIL